MVHIPVGQGQSHCGISRRRSNLCVATAAGGVGPGHVRRNIFFACSRYYAKPSRLTASFVTYRDISSVMDRHIGNNCVYRAGSKHGVCFLMIMISNTRARGRVGSCHVRSASMINIFFTRSRAWEVVDDDQEGDSLNSATISEMVRGQDPRARDEGITNISGSWFARIVYCQIDLS
ncbi:hypothetical protein PM082_013594 [Marasmius tenuissimus]|nr:hypothetical protein PM082_013594 [Marasmius tenuissimus]